jgi:pyrroloquinoline quinone biosynthesis protein B
LKIKVLGSGQDAGTPHTGCHCDTCKKARKYKKYRRLAPSIALWDEKEGFCYFIDASPDFKLQLDMVREETDRMKRKGRVPLSGILLTHAHLGHYLGLAYLGKESIAEKNIPVFCSPKMQDFLSSNYPFSLLVEEKTIIINEVHPSDESKLDSISCVPLQVPHRDEMADTVGYIIKSGKKMLYLPDVDYWTDSILEAINMVDVALLDGTFYSRDELPRFKDSKTFHTHPSKKRSAFWSTRIPMFTSPTSITQTS